ncbi:MAG TPA: hypothetical protein VK622_10030 [Puia sp.]|nr:hypothetical protein [Puia sp.]
MEIHSIDFGGHFLGLFGLVIDAHMEDAESAGILFQNTVEILADDIDDKSKTDDQSRLFKKGSVYYDQRLLHNFKRDTDSTGSPINEPAKDTLRNF